MEGATARHEVVHARGRVLAIVGCAVAIAVVAWPVRTLAPEMFGDWSWVAGLSYATEHRLPFGQRLVWTYGPLGFLDTWYGPRLFYSDLVVAAWLFRALVQVLLAGTLLAALRRVLPLPVAALVAAVALALVTDAPLALGFAWCVLLVADAREDADALDAADRPPAPALAPALPVALGLLVGVMALGKLNQGAELLALAAVALAAAPRRRELLAFAVTLLVTAVTGWLATGQTLADVWPYMRNGLELIAGYAAAMGTPPLHRWVYAAGTVLTLLALALAWDRVRFADVRRRAGLLALCAIYLVFALKEGFVLADDVHVEAFFGDLLVLFAVLPVRASRRPLLLGGLAAGVVAFAVVAGGHDAVRTLNPYANAKAAADQARTIASASRLDQITAELRTTTRETYAVAPQLLAAIGPRPVMLWPNLYGEVAWAYDLNLRPLMTLETYAAYTPRLDRLAAQALASDAAPERILQAALTVAPTVNAAHPAHAVPLATREILCRYRPIASEDPWQVLERTANRCGLPRTLGHATADWGKTVTVPAARRSEALVVAKIDGAGLQRTEQLMGLLLRPRHRWIKLDGKRYFLVTATAADGLLLTAPPSADYPQPFTFAPNPRTIAVGRFDGQPDGELRYTFVEIPIRPFAG